MQVVERRNVRWPISPPVYVETGVLRRAVTYQHSRDLKSPATITTHRYANAHAVCFQATNLHQFALAGPSVRPARRFEAFASKSGALCVLSRARVNPATIVTLQPTQIERQ